MPVAALSYGLQKRVELARALAMRPRILLLDEPVAGMNREETEDMARFILDVKEEWGTTILMVEHDMGMVMDISDHVVVLNFGQVIASGLPHEVQADPACHRSLSGQRRPGRPDGAAQGRRAGYRPQPGGSGMSDLLFFTEVSAGRSRLRRAAGADRACLRADLQGNARHQPGRRRDADGSAATCSSPSPQVSACRPSPRSPLAVAGGGLVGAIVERGLIRPMLGENPISVFMVTIGLGSGAGRTG